MFLVPSFSGSKLDFWHSIIFANISQMVGDRANITIAIIEEIIEWRYFKCCTPWIWPIFQGKEMSGNHTILNILKTVRASEGWYWSNVGIANVVHCALNLYFQGHIFAGNDIVNIWKTVQPSERHKYDSYRDWYWPSNGTFANVVDRDLDLFFKVTKFLEII